jgi:DNA ligase-1
MAIGKSGGGAGKAAAPKAAGARAGKAAGSKADKGAVVPPPVLLAHVWENDVELLGWWMSEKLDGVRAYWDGRRFLSRLGNEYIAPDWFVAGLPNTPLDGELWVGRKQFQRCVSIVRRQEAHDEWREVRYLIFDAPAHEAPFEERQQHIKDTLARHKPAYAQHHPQEVCRGTDHMRDELRRVEGLGGEGLMMRRPRSRYEVGRSHTLLKVKSFHDAEARVIGHQEGTGKHKGRLGALLVEMPNGIQFAVGTGLSDAERSSPPAIGSIITYRYQELSDGGVPRFPSYVGVRHDFAWPGTTAKPTASGAPSTTAKATKTGKAAKATKTAK